MLLKAAPIVKAYLAEDGPHFNLLNSIEKQYDEAHIHSKIIFELLSKIFYEDNDMSFLKLFLIQLSVPQGHIDKLWTPYRERCFDNGRIDFVLECKDFCIAIEMKINAGDQSLQLKRYEDFCKSRNKDYAIYYLTLDGKKPSMQSMGRMNKNRLRLISFKQDIVLWLLKCMDMVEPDSYMYSYLKQYMGTVKHLTSEGNDEGMLKEIITTTNEAKTAAFLIEALMLKMGNIIGDFLLNLKHIIEKETGYKTSLDMDAAKEYYWSSNNTYPGIVTEIDSFGVGKTTYILIVYAEIDSKLYSGIGFHKKTGAEKGWVELSEVEKKAPQFYDKWMSKIDSLHLNAAKKSANSTYFYIENTQGKTIDFRNYSSEALDLIDNFDMELEYISDYLINQVIRKLCVD